jgi:hypothetical protein
MIRGGLAAKTGSVLRRVGVDQAVGRTLLTRGWLGVSGLVSFLLLTRSLTMSQQFYYVTFVSILGLQAFFELGLSTVVLQFASHERAELEWTESGTLDGSPRAKARLAALLRFSLLWYGIVALLVGLVLLPGGLIYFHAFPPAGAAVAWQMPWFWIVLVTAGALALSPLLSLLQGCGLVAEVAGVQLAQGVIGTLLFWLTLLLHWGLYTAPITNTVALVFSAIWVWRRQRFVIGDLLQTPPTANVFHWKRDIWPFQWKVGLSWLAGYFIFQLFVPSLGAMHHPVAAAQLGMSANVVGAISGLALAWMVTKSAPFGTLIAKREFQALDRLFFSCLWQSLTVAVVCSALLMTAVIFLNHIHYPLALRILRPWPFALLIAAVLVNHVTQCEAIYLRAHKQEPFLWISICAAPLIVAVIYFLGIPYAATGMMFGYFVVLLVIGLGGGTWVFAQKRRQWHEAPTPSLPDPLSESNAPSVT